MRRPEVLAPAGDAARLQAALDFGADAVYLAGTRYGLRTAPTNFDEAGLRDAVALAHRRGVPVYVTCNSLPTNADLTDLPAFLEQVQDAGADALIVADMGVLALAKRHAPRCAVHMSTQTGVVNYATARALHDLGASRVVLARELSLDEVAAIRAHTPPALELEAFVHGAMCMAVSGRCLLSHYLTGRSADRGDCVQPCRWTYALVEEQRPGQYFPIDEGAGTTLMSAYDLCMLAHVADLGRAGVCSFKIEGRAKAAYYVAVITRAYRLAVDGWQAAGFAADYQPPAWLTTEVETVSHRSYSTGFYYGPPQQNLADHGYLRPWRVAAMAVEWADGVQWLEQRNRFVCGEMLEVVVPYAPEQPADAQRPWPLTCDGLCDEHGVPLAAAPHAQMRVGVPLTRPLPPGSLLRQRNPDAERADD